MKPPAIFILLLLAIVVNARAQDASVSTNNGLQPVNFRNLSFDASKDAVDYAVGEVAKGKRLSSSYVTNLIYQLGTDNLPDDKKVFVIYLLGKLYGGDADSLEILIKHIDLRTQPDWGPSGEFSSRFTMRWGSYPAREALVNIGKPTLIPLLNHLAKETDAPRRDSMCAVMKQVAGVEAAVGQIKQRLSDERDPANRANLESALREIEKR